MKRFLVTLFFTGIVILLTSVDCKRITGQRYIFIKNNSDRRIDYYFEDNTPNTSINCDPDNEHLYLVLIDPHSVDSLHTYRATSGWDAFLENVLLVIFDSDIHDKYMFEPCDVILQNVPILATYNLTLEDMQKLNWTITYPPTEEMIGMDIYLPNEDPLTEK